MMKIIRTGAVALSLLLIGAAPRSSPGCEVKEPTAPSARSAMAGSAPSVTAGSAPSFDDVARARAACEQARARFAELFGGPAPSVLVVLWDQPGYRMGTDGERAAIFWPTSTTMVAQAGGGSAADAHVAAQWREVLPHETAHALLSARFFASDAPAWAAAGSPDSEHAPATYGTPLPDWLDEGVAIWAEPIESRQRRLAHARALPESMRELTAILGGAHPALENTAAWRMRDGAPPPSDEALWASYPQSIAVLEFIFERGGSEALLELVHRLKNEPHAATSALEGLPGMAADPRELQETWERVAGARAGGALTRGRACGGDPPASAVIVCPQELLVAMAPTGGTLPRAVILCPREMLVGGWRPSGLVRSQRRLGGNGPRVRCLWAEHQQLPGTEHEAAGMGAPPVRRSRPPDVSQDLARTNSSRGQSTTNQQKWSCRSAAPCPQRC